MRAMIRFVESDDDEQFRMRAMELVTTNAQFVVEENISRFSRRIVHTDQERAVTFITLLLATVVATRVLEAFSLWTDMRKRPFRAVCVLQQRRRNYPMR